MMNKNLTVPIIFLSPVKVFYVFVMMLEHLDGPPSKLYVTHGKISKPRYDVLVRVI